MKGAESILFSYLHESPMLLTSEEKNAYMLNALPFSYWITLIAETIFWGF